MKTYIFMIALLFAGYTAVAQDKYFYVALDVNKPLSNTAWVDDFSARGARAGYRVFITPEISAGLDVSWTTFDKYVPQQTIENDAGAITTDWFNYVYSYSLAASGQYNFTVGKRIIPYAGIGLGAVRNEYTRYYNIYTESGDAWGFLARPEAGVLLRFGQRRSLGAMAAIHYDYATASMEKLGYDRFTTIGFQVGLVFLDR